MLNGVIGQGGLVSFHRARLLDLFASSIPSENVHFNKRLLSYAQTDDIVELKFEDGTNDKADALIGADGVNSIVRKQILKSHMGRLGDADEDGKARLSRCIQRK